MKVSEFIATHLHLSGKTQVEVAREVGFSSSNIVSMVKTGVTKVPLCRVPALADSLCVSAQELLLLCLREYEPELMAIIETVLPGVLLSQADVDIVTFMKATLGK